MGEYVPLALYRRTPPAFRHRHLAGGKQDDDAPGIQVLHRLIPHLQAQLACVVFVREGHGDHEFRDLGNTGQKRPSQDLEVGSHAVDHFGQHHSVYQPRRMVRDHHNCTGRRDAGDLFGRRINADAHVAYRLGPEGCPERRARLLEAADQAQELNLGGQPFQRADRTGLPWILERAGIGKPPHIVLIVGRNRLMRAIVQNSVVPQTL